MSDTLPAPVERWLSGLDARATTPFDTAVLEGRARFRREGKGRWWPVEAVRWHELGRDHVADTRLGLGPLTIVRAMDGCVDGTGFSRVSHTLDVGPEVDHSAALSMWSEAILFPGAWLERDDIAWIGVDDHTVEISLPLAERRLPARLTFEPATGVPARFSGDRHKGAGSRAVEWSVEYEDWRPTADGVMLPSVTTATWSDDPGPWFRMWIERANPGADVSGAMARGRTLLAEVAADPTR